MTASSSFPLKISYALSPRPTATTFKNFYPCLYRTSILRLSSPILTSKSTGLLSSLETIGRHTFFSPACVGDTNAVTIESAEEDIPLNRVPNPTTKNDVEENNEESISMNVASEGLGEHKMVRICDKLIGVFMVDKPTPTDWRRLLIFSKEWSNIRPYFYKQCQDRADSENNPEMKHKLLRLARKLKEIDEDVLRHNKLLDEIRKSSSDVGDIVARRRKDFTKEFFLHLHTVSESFYDNPVEREAIVKIADRCLVAVQAYDTATESLEALTAAETKFEDIINSPTLDAACRKIDNLAEKNQLDSTLVLMITKAWSAAKESNMMKDEVKDVLYHLYKTARGNLQRLMPKEIRILKYLLTIQDPEERMSALKDAFTPGEEVEGNDVDSLYTTPEQLHTWIRTVVDAYNFSREGTLIREARDLMNPIIVQKMEELTKTIQDNFM
ncbi:uncharacterized protein At4g37920-like [Primulina huaijiensis]|uniref:uncharacterized protein At4g37920-like n=1 Tax=Primulina huaijiensis TaxID=1492673 RepID=UPI003CC75D73